MKDCLELHYTDLKCVYMKRDVNSCWGHHRPEGHRGHNRSQQSNISSRPPAVRTHVILLKVNERADNNRSFFLCHFWSFVCSVLLMENSWNANSDADWIIVTWQSKLNLPLSECVYKTKGSFNNAPCNHTDTDKLIIIIKAPRADSVQSRCECLRVAQDEMH